MVLIMNTSQVLNDCIELINICKQELFNYSEIPKNLLEKYDK